MPLYLQISARKKGSSWNSSFFQGLSLFNLDGAEVFAQAMSAPFFNGWNNLKLNPISFGFVNTKILLKQMSSETLFASSCH